MSTDKAGTSIAHTGRHSSCHIGIFEETVTYSPTKRSRRTTGVRKRSALDALASTVVGFTDKPADFADEFANGHEGTSASHHDANSGLGINPNHEDIMLSYVTTSLFDSPAQTLVNTVNTVGVMGKGIAADFKRRYPDMFHRYAEFCRTGQLDIGKLYLYRTPNKLILNFPTKKHWRNPSRIEYIEAGLQKFVDTYTSYGITSISFPQLGCGNGGLPWKSVRILMEKYLRTLPIPVYIHVAEPKQGFIPEHLDTGKIQDEMLSRRDISFHDFFSALWYIARMPGDVPNITPECHDEPLPAIELRSATNQIARLPGDDLEILWTKLRLRGALPEHDFPGELRAHSSLVRELLLRLDFVRPIQFAIADNSGQAQKIPGVQFAPGAAREAVDAVKSEPMS